MDEAPFNSEVSEGPQDGKTYWIHTIDGLRLRVGFWNPKSVNRGTILLFTARSEYLEKYGHTIQDFLHRGYAVFAIDWRGQGLSDRLTNDPRTGHVERFLDYQKDVAAMMHAADILEAPKPRFLFGSSMGACIGLRALDEGLSVNASAFSAPMWDISLSPFERQLALPISWIVQSLGMGHMYTPGRKGQSYVLSVPFERNDLTNDAQMYEYYVRQAKALPETQIGSPSMGWLHQALRECSYLKRLPSPDVPCISFCGDEDEVVDRQTIIDRMARWEGGQFKEVSGGKHDLLCDVSLIRNSVTDQIANLFSSTARNLSHKAS